MVKERSIGKTKSGKIEPTGLWMLKSEPWDISWKRLSQEKDVLWDNVRNFQANNYMKLMKVGDLCLFYHSVEDKALFGVAEILRTWSPDPKDSTGRFGVLRIGPHKALKKPVSLAELKAEPRLNNLQFLRQVRLSVSIITQKEWDVVIELSRNSV